jgi:hypothetical protein
VRSVARQIARQAAAPWPGLQRASGSFRDDVRWPTPYGEAILGYGLLGVGLREHDDRLVRSAMRSFDWVLTHRAKRARPSVFQNWSMAASYNLARRAIPHDRRFTRLLPRWRAFLRRQELRRLKPTGRYGNHQLVEALEVLELQRTGLRGGTRKAALGPRRREYIRRALQLLNGRIPAMARARTVNVHGDPTYLLSDPPDEPMAYLGLSLGLYARGLDLLGGRATGTTHRVLRRVAEASWHLAAPDGDLGWMGRNSAEAWILSATAFGGHEGRRPRTQGVALRALQRLALVHGGAPGGLYIVPGLRQNVSTGKKAVDGSGGTGEFVGLTLVFLNLLADSHSTGPAPAGVAADRDGGAVLGRGDSLRAVMRHGDVWYATRAAPSVLRAGDLRYDPGLIVLKHRRPNGAWRDLIPLRPRVSLFAPADGTGPLIRTSRGRAVFAASRIARRAGGAVDLIGAYRHLGGGGGIGRRGSERIEPAAGCGGAQVSFSARAGERFEYSVFLRESGSHAQSGPNSVTSGGTRVTFTPGAKVELRRGYVSASDPFVVRARLRWRTSAAQAVRVTICDAG